MHNKYILSGNKEFLDITAGATYVSNGLQTLKDGS
jgi:hypothetical protein